MTKHSSKAVNNKKIKYNFHLGVCADESKRKRKKNGNKASRPQTKELESKNISSVFVC